jgi:hypothetical protein
MKKTAKQIYKYIKSQPWFREYVYEIHNSDVLNEKKTMEYINGLGDYYTITGAFDWAKTNAGYEKWQERNNQFLRWYERN